MRQINILILVILFILISCKGKALSNSPLAFVDTTKPFKKEIPTYQNGVNIFYEMAKTKQKQLGLDSIENGFDNLQIRVWYDFDLVKKRKLVVITNKNGNWTATVYDLQVDWDGHTETILSKKLKQVTPKSGWADFSKQLMNLQILTLPDQDDIPNYAEGMDGRTYNVEVATKTQYRFYGYWEPREHQNKFWQAKNMSDILKLFRTELGVG